MDGCGQRWTVMDRCGQVDCDGRMWTVVQRRAGSRVSNARPLEDRWRLRRNQTLNGDTVSCVQRKWQISKCEVKQMNCH